APRSPPPSAGRPSPPPSAAPRKLEYVPFSFELVLTQTPETTTLANLSTGASFVFNDPVESVNNTPAFAGTADGFAFFTQGLNFTTGEAVIEIVATIVSAANPRDTFAIIGPSNSLSNVVTDVAVVGGTGRFAGATGAGKIRVIQFIPADTTILRLAFFFFALATPLPVPAV
ncbi:hypothetical protein KFL_007060100, partial [Klebsormidium nitens]